MVITSLENDRIKKYVKLQKKKNRDLENLYIVEGDHLVIEADKAGVIEEIILLDGVQDPGNLGTIIRSSLAFDVSTIVLLENSVDLYNPKVLRATQGMYNYINIVNKTFDDVYKYARDNEINIYGTSVVNGVDASALEATERNAYCLIMGNEGQGIRDEIFEKCDKNLYIKMNDKVESLNVGVACSILLYELGR